MPREEAISPEENDFELVLGNKQLLSVFFIVVILLGVFFTMGYMVGRNSAPVDTVSKQNQPYERQNAPSAAPSAIVRQPASEQQAEVATPAATPEVAPAKAAKPVEQPPVTVTQPQIGRTYVQVMSVARPEAEVLADVLAKKGFRALVAPGPNDRLFRVLVGPAKDDVEAAKLRTDLAAATGAKPFIKRY